MGQARFDYYTTFALAVSVDLVNTRAEPTGDDALASAADLGRLLDAYRGMDSTHADNAVPAGVDLAAVAELYGTALARWEPTEADARELQALRARLRTLFDTAAADPRGAVALLNEQLRAYRALPRISDQHGAPHLHFEAAEDGLVHWLAVTALMGLVMFVCDGHAGRLGSCASASCRRVFVDRSKNGSKTYCTDQCAHRESVAAFRARQRARRSPTGRG